MNTVKRIGYMALLLLILLAAARPASGQGDLQMGGTARCDHW
jgi:hypothetical protein